MIRGFWAKSYSVVFINVQFSLLKWAYFHTGSAKEKCQYKSANKIVLPYNLKCAFLVSNVLKACDVYQLQMLADCIVVISGISSIYFL